MTHAGIGNSKYTQGGSFYGWIPQKFITSEYGKSVVACRDIFDDRICACLAVCSGSAGAEQQEEKESTASRRQRQRPSGCASVGRATDRLSAQRVSRRVANRRHGKNAQGLFRRRDGCGRRVER